MKDTALESAGTTAEKAWRFGERDTGKRYGAREGVGEPGKVSADKRFSIYILY